MIRIKKCLSMFYIQFRSAFKVSKRLGTYLVLGPPKKFYSRNLSGIVRDVHWYYLRQGLTANKNQSLWYMSISKMEIWTLWLLSWPIFKNFLSKINHYGPFLKRLKKKIVQMGPRCWFLEKKYWNYARIKIWPRVK